MTSTRGKKRKKRKTNVIHLSSLFISFLPCCYNIKVKVGLISSVGKSLFGKTVNSFLLNEHVHNARLKEEK